MATLQEMDRQQSPVRPSASLLLATAPPALKRHKGSSLSSSEHQSTTTKPLWAPLETDAPITLASRNDGEAHVCQLCSCWYETRKGLSSHARFHLRQLGIPDSEIKGSAIDFLYQIMNEEDLKSFSNDRQEPRSENGLPGTPPKRPSESGLSSSYASPPCKRPKPSEECTCTLCGEKCKNRRGLASHARSHLRQIGVLDLLGKEESAIDTIQDLVSSGVLETMHSPKMKSSSSFNAVPSSAPASPIASPPVSPVTGQSRSPLPSTFQSLAKSPQIPGNRAPKAKKGFRLAVDPLLRKPKPEPLEVDVSALIGSSSSSSSTATLSLPALATPSTSLRADEQSPPTVLCDYCGQLFETRKALSCHARAHLRQLGLTWSIKTSPIDLLKDIMMQGEDGNKVLLSGEALLLKKVSWSPQRSKRILDSTSNSCSSPLDYSMKVKPAYGKSEALSLDASCEVCGYNFENRTALASHARAHLRQLGVVEWKAEGATSPIEHLKEFMQKHPAQVAALARRYQEGELCIKKKGSSLSTLSDLESLPASDLKISGHNSGKEDQGVSVGSPKKPPGHASSVAACGNAGVRSPKERTLPKQLAPAAEENQDTNSQQLSRSSNIPALLPKPPLTPLVKLVGKVYSLKCRFCEKVFHGPLSVQEQWITHLQKHILSLGYKGKESPPAASVSPPAFIHPVAV